MSREDKELSLLLQLPEEDAVDVAVLGEYPPQEEFVYPLKHDKVLTLPLNKFDEDGAKRRLAAICVLQRWSPLGEVFYTGRFWCQRVMKKTQ